ncbi:MAG: hypothetical protein ACPF9D_08210 [Owenweeksia sp.]
MAILLKKIKATTLVETLVAMTILSLVSGMAMVIFMQVSAPASSVTYLMEAQQRSAEMMDTLSSDYLYGKSGIIIDLETDKLYYEGEILEYADELFQVQLNVLDNNGRQVYQRRRLYYVHERK